MLSQGGFERYWGWIEWCGNLVHVEYEAPKSADMLANIGAEMADEFGGDIMAILDHCGEYAG